jgi:hypothetical protein
MSEAAHLLDTIIIELVRPKARRIRTQEKKSVASSHCRFTRDHRITGHVAVA